MPEFDNLDLANRITVLILADCLKSYPSPSEIDWRSIARRLAKETKIEGLAEVPDHYMSAERIPVLNPDRFVDRVAVSGDQRDLRVVIHDMLDWLSREGFVHYQPNFTSTYGSDGSVLISHQASPSRTTITAKAHAVLGTMPDALGEKRTLAEAVRSAGSIAGTAGLGEVSGLLVRTIFRYTTGLG